MDKTENFINKAVKIHKNTYSYCNTVYKKAKEKVAITCPKHGDFLMTPNNHLSGQGCPACNGKTKVTTETFIEKAKEVHGDTYDYSLVTYVSMKKPVEIICKEHGVFVTTPDSHLRGGCRKCADKANSLNHMYSQKYFIEQSTLIHNNYYDYSKVNYTKSKNKVTIICPVHGEFEQIASAHINGHGCSSCASSNALYQDKPTNLYLVKLTKFDIVRYKVGITIHDVLNRFKSELRNDVKVDTIAIYQFITGRDAFLLEQKLLKLYTDYKNPIKNLLYCDSGITELLSPEYEEIYLQIFNNHLPLKE